MGIRFVRCATCGLDYPSGCLHACQEGDVEKRLWHNDRQQARTLGTTPTTDLRRAAPFEGWVTR